MGGVGGFRLKGAVSSSRNNNNTYMCEGVCVWGGSADQKDINMWV